MSLKPFSSSSVGAIILVASGVVIGGESHINYHDEASGVFVSSIIDTNQDGVPGVTTTLYGRSSLGPVNISSFSEFNPLNAADSANCIFPKIEFPVVESSTVHRFVNGDLLYLKTTQEVFCADRYTGEFEWTETLIITGGTGKYTNASGTINASGSGKVLSADPTGVFNFGALKMTNRGTIYIPRGRH